MGLVCLDFGLLRFRLADSWLPVVVLCLLFTFVFAVCWLVVICAVF